MLLTVEQVKDRIIRLVGDSPATAPIEDLVEYFSDPSWRTEEALGFGLSVLIDLEAFGSAEGVEAALTIPR